LAEQVWKNSDVLKALMNCVPQDDNRLSVTEHDLSKVIDLKKELINTFANIAIAGTY